MQKSALNSASALNSVIPPKPVKQEPVSPAKVQKLTVKREIVSPVKKHVSFVRFYSKLCMNINKQST